MHLLLERKPEGTFPSETSRTFCNGIDNLHRMFGSSGGCGSPDSGPGKETDVNMATKMGD